MGIKDKSFGGRVYGNIKILGILNVSSLCEHNIL